MLRRRGAAVHVSATLKPLILFALLALAGNVPAHADPVRTAVEQVVADYVGLYFVALAGFDPNRAASAWRRMAVVNPAAIDHVGTHPTTAERFVALEAAAREISTKIAQGQPLRPNMQE